MPQHTPLFDAHVASGARMVDFGGWEMPINYGSQIEEHHKVRQAAGMFDVSHMTVVDITGSQSRLFLSYLLASDVARLNTPGRALYSCMLNEQGGIIDDLITYFLDETFFRMVVNAATHDKDMAWLELFNAVTLQMGPKAMLAIKIRMREDMPVGEAARAINELERDIKKAIPDIGWCFVEIDVTD